jgi:UDP-N-acetylmuramoyl-tripeptide--D-alanyl-D-alanine ligase
MVVERERAVTSNAPTLDAAFVAAALGDLLLSRSGPDRGFARAVIDSRLVQPGDLFVALPGETADGHSFVAAAVDAGASGLLVARPTERLDEASGPAQFVVADPLAALQRIAVAWRAALPSTDVIGITGNVGKTTTKLITAAVLGARYRVQASEQNYNNEIGVPLCLLETRPETQRAVIEMGMYTTTEIALLCEWTQPRIGVVLNVGPVHLERAGSLETIIAAKRELPEALPADGHAILNADDPDVLAMASHTAARVWLFGVKSAELDVRGSEVTSHGADGFEFELTASGQSRRLRVPLPGAHLVSNVLAAAAVGLADGMAFDAVCDAIEALDVPLRLSVRRIAGGVTLLDDTYNANPASMLAALDLLSQLPGRRIALLGDMRELGELTEQSHDRIGRRAAEVLDSLLTIGDLAVRIAESARAAGLDGARHFASKEQATAALRDQLREGDVLLVKGSRALELETVVHALDEEGMAS